MVNYLFKIDKIITIIWWHYGLERKKIGYIDESGNAVTTWDRDGAYKVLNKSENGSLKLINVGRHLVERY